MHDNPSRREQRSQSDRQKKRREKNVDKEIERNKGEKHGETEKGRDMISFASLTLPRRHDQA